MKAELKSNINFGAFCKCRKLNVTATYNIRCNNGRIYKTNIVP